MLPGPLLACLGSGSKCFCLHIILLWYGSSGNTCSSLNMPFLRFRLLLECTYRCVGGMVPCGRRENISGRRELRDSTYGIFSPWGGTACRLDQSSWVQNRQWCSLGYYGFLVTERLGTSMLHGRSIRYPFRLYCPTYYTMVSATWPRRKLCACFVVAQS